jgi:TRAP-type C4-dicarboxylate transport system permease small subunit
MTIVTFMAAFNRFTIQIAMPWTDELVRFMLLWMTMVGAALGINTGVHVGINVITDLFPPKLRLNVARVMNLVGIVFTVIFLNIGIKIVKAQYIQKSTAMTISMGWVYGCIIAGAILMFFEFVYLLYLSFKGGESK